jgi:integrase
LEWSVFRFKENVIRIEPTQFFHPKSEDSIGEIQVDPEIIAIFRQYHAKTKGRFVIPSRRPPKTVFRGDYYRCEQHMERLNAWLREKGVTTQKPLHTLRKGFGSLVNQAHGIHAASKALRHADSNVTNNFYTDSRVRVTPRLGTLFERKRSDKANSHIGIPLIGPNEKQNETGRTTSEHAKTPSLPTAK